MAPPLTVAVIGAGVAGLAAARALKTEGHQVTIYEKSDQLGGTWVYDPRVESDPLGLDPSREIVHGSLYPSLRTNLPRQLMGFSDYPFRSRKNGDSRNFPGHKEVLNFLNEFAEDFGLVELIRFGTEVIRVELVGPRDDKWVVGSRTRGRGSEEIFDAVVVCNGHHTQPRLAHFPGMEKWPGKQLHSHNYRGPEPFQDKIDCVHENGEVSFQDGACLHADIILHCTGYNYHFPFLKTHGIVTVDDNRVGPLYKHVFPPKLAPTLSFVGLPYRGVVILVIDLQAKWIAQVLSGKRNLPSKEEMLADFEQHYKHMEEKGIPKHHTHCLGQEMFWKYLEWLATEAGIGEVDEEIKLIIKSYYNFVDDNSFWRAKEWDPTKELQDMEL